MVQKFDEMDKDKNGYLDMNEAREGLKTLKTADGSPLDENEIDFFLKTASRDDEKLDLAEFANLLARLKVYKKPWANAGFKISHIHSGCFFVHIELGLIFYSEQWPMHQACTSKTAVWHP